MIALRTAVWLVRIPTPRLPNPSAHPRSQVHVTARGTAIKHIEPQRPTLDDVQRLSEGRAARSRGFGSRQIPHRLNNEEREAYKLARQRGYLTLKGSGYRRERKGSPLANIFRQLNDALGRPCVIVEQRSGAGALDIVMVDLSPLRLLDYTEADAATQSIAAELGIPAVPPERCNSPFTVILPTVALETATLEETGVQAEDGDMEEHVLTAPVWQLLPKLICFECSRPTAKVLSKKFVDCGKYVSDGVSAPSDASL